MPIALPVNAATASPTAAFSASPSPANNAPFGGGNDQAVSQAGQGSNNQAQGAAQAAQVNQNSPNAQSPQTDPQSPQNIFARMLDAHMAVLEGGLSGPGAVSSDEDGGKSDKARDGDAASLSANVDPLPNPALLLLQQVVPATPVNNAPVQNDVQSNQNTQNNSLGAAAAATLPQDAAAIKDSKQTPLGGEVKGADLFQAMSADAEKGLQKLPPSEGAQSTNLPQQLGLQVNSTVSREQQVKPTFTIPQSVGTPAWSQSLSDKVLSMVSIKAETAHIQLNPPELGPIDVTLKMDGHNTAQVTFNADSATTRAALQDSLPRLQSMMASSGIQLGDAQVSGGQSQQQQQNARNQRGNAQPQAQEGEEFDTLATIKAARGVLSIFA
ncbi:hypothetical protein THUN1379_11800 [Paludibacterium sp. THUN1379]|uniref:flagellar hook-length control protein FliK n=1 Tax=Paludibacterium sp. THUN1379 TaxID=3112107 RepID=UPI003084F316|nr:hypothetical protein THUN1379_11800 [Paludibacterium sp. THUN1379]